jgi:hypothetical protein
MKQVITGVSIFVGLQIVYVVVLLGLTMWEGRQLGRPKRQAAPARQALTGRPREEG